MFSIKMQPFAKNCMDRIQIVYQKLIKQHIGIFSHRTWETLGTHHYKRCVCTQNFLVISNVLCITSQMVTQYIIGETRMFIPFISP